MLLITDLYDIPSFDQPCGVTIGNFDGVHRGHQALIQHLRAKLPSNGLLCLFTFSNHPSQFFNPASAIPLICSPLQKIKHLEDYGVDIVFLIPFTDAFANLSSIDFLKLLKRHLGFSHLSLGTGATFGKNREGDEIQIRRLTEPLNFEVDYLQKYLVNGTPVSSGRIRALINQGNYLEIQECLGRPYSLMGRIAEEENRYCLHFPGICLPPTGIYPIHLKTSSHTYSGQAHIEQKAQKIQLTLVENPNSLKGKDAEIVFNS